MSLLRLLRRDRVPSVVAAVLVVVGLLVGALVAVGRMRQQEAARAAYLESQQAAVNRRLTDTVSDLVRVLEGVRGHFAAGNDSREAFRTYVDVGPLDLDGSEDAPGVAAVRDDGLTMLGFVRAVTSDHLDAFLDARRAEAVPGFDRVYEDLPEHFIVDYVEPRSTAQGTDLSTLLSRRMPLEAARETGEATATDWFVPVTATTETQDAETDKIFGIYLPVYEGGEVPRTSAERRAAHIGWAVTNARAEVFASKVMPEDVASGACFELFDGSVADPQRRVLNVRQPTVPLASDQLVWTVSPLGHDWTIRYTPTEAQLAQATSGLSPASLFLLIFASALVPAGFILQLGHARRVAEERAVTSTAALRRSEMSLRTLADTVPVAIFDLDEQERLSFVNDAWEQRTAGVRSSDALVWLPNVHPDDAAKAFFDWQQARRAREAMTGRYRLVDAAGEVRWADVIVVPIADGDGAISRVIGCLVDVSRVVDFERELSSARDQALLASQVKSDFLANVSHEVRTPLNGVIGMAELLLAEDLSAEQHERVKALHSAGTYLLDLVDQVLDFSKVEAGKIRIESVPFDLTDVLHGVEVMYQPTARDRGLSFRIVVDHDVPRRIVSDPTRLRQVLGNLVNNALKFTPTGGVEVRVRVPRLDDESATLHVAVVDTGIGIPASEHVRIFHPFIQADTSTTRRFGGTGLGLAIVSEVVRLMGGEIGVESADGVGSTFWFTLPVVRSGGSRVESLDQAFRAVTVHAERPGQLPETPAPATAPAEGPASLVLLVEDNAVNQMVARGLLESIGYRVDVAGDGVEALGRLRTGGPYDAVLMDCQMPRLDGYSTTARIRALEGGVARVPIIAMTASVLAEDHRRCREAGMDAVVTKPVRRELLASVLGQVLRR